MRKQNFFRTLIGIFTIVVGVQGSVFLFQPSTIFAKETGDSGYVPGSPTNLVATAVSDSQINITWSSPSSNEFAAPPSTFVIYRTTGNDTNFSGLSPYATVSAAVVSFSDTGLSASTQYNYKVAARGSNNLESGNSNLASATTQAAVVTPPNPPSNLVVTGATTNPNQISLSWTAASGPLDYYIVYRGIDSINLNSYGSGSATSFVDSGVTPGVTYYYKVASYKSTGNLMSSFTNTVNASVSAPVPTGLTATAVSDSQINLSWSWSGGSGVFFIIERSLDGSSGWTRLPDSVATTYQDKNLAANTRYYYRVAAFTTGYGNYSDIANDKTFEKQGGVISISMQVINLTATPDCPSRINLMWNGVSGANQYTIQRGINSNVNFVSVGSISGTSYTDSGLVKGNNYYYKIVANDSQNSASNIASFQLTCDSNPTSIGTSYATNTPPGGGLSSSYGTPSSGGISVGTGSGSAGQPGGISTGYGGTSGGPGGGLISVGGGTGSPNCLSSDSMPPVEWRGVTYTSPNNPSSGIVFGVLPDKSSFARRETVAFKYCWQNPSKKVRRIRVTRQLFNKDGAAVPGTLVSNTRTLAAGQTFTLDRTRVLGANLAPGPYKEEVKITHLYRVNGDIPLDSDNAFWIKIGEEGDPGVGSRGASASSSDPAGGLSVGYGTPGNSFNPGANSSAGSNPPPSSPGGLSGSYGGGSGSGPSGGLSVGYGSASSSDPTGGLSGASASFGPGPGSVPSPFSPIPHTDPPGKPGSPGIIYEFLPGKDSFPPGALIPFGIAFTPVAGDGRAVDFFHKIIGPNGEVIEEIKLDPPVPGVRDPGVDPNDPPPGGGGPGVGDPGRGSRRAVGRRLPAHLPPGTYTSVTEVRDRTTRELIDSTSFMFSVFRGSK